MARHKLDGPLIRAALFSPFLHGDVELPRRTLCYLLFFSVRSDADAEFAVRAA